MWEELGNVKFLQYTPTQVLAFFMLRQCNNIESGEDDNDIMTNRNGVNTDAVGQPTFWEDNGFYGWFYWITIKNVFEQT